MAGSISHITDKEGRFTMEQIEKMHDARMALEEAHGVIALLCEGNLDRLNAALEVLDFPPLKLVPLVDVMHVGAYEAMLAHYGLRTGFGPVEVPSSGPWLYVRRSAVPCFYSKDNGWTSNPGEVQAFQLEHVISLIRDLKETEPSVEAVLFP